MVKLSLCRRGVLAGVAAIGFGPKLAWGQDFVDLLWKDLLPEGEVAPPPILQELIQHDQAPLSSLQPQSSGVRSDWNGQIVRLPGFIVPIDYSGTSVTAFILVPYVGACVHVPPPPANQLVFVTTKEPYESKGLFDPVNVIGKFAVSSITTDLATAGYAISADRIEAYKT